MKTISTLFFSFFLLAINANAKTNLVTTKVYNGGDSSANFSVMPITLTKFSGSLNSEKVQLSWQVAENNMVETFVVEKSTDGKIFTPAGIVFTTDKSRPEAYTFADRSATTKTIYRLRMNSRNGTPEYSKNLMFTTNAGTTPQALNIINNPVVSHLTFNYLAAEGNSVTLSVYNNTGTKIYSRNEASNKGINQYTIESSSLTNQGAYIIEVVSKEGNKATAKFLKI